MKLFSHNYNPDVDCYSISTQTPTEGRVVLPEEELVLCGMTLRGNANKDISRGECENTLTHFPVRGERGDTLEVAGILPLSPPSPVVITRAKDGKEEDRDEAWSSLLRHPAPGTGCDSQGSHPNNPTRTLQLHGPGSRSHKLTFHQDTHSCFLMETIFFSCSFQIHQLNRRILFGHRLLPLQVFWEFLHS